MRARLVGAVALSFSLMSANSSVLLANDVGAGDRYNPGGNPANQPDSTPSQSGVQAKVSTDNAAPEGRNLRRAGILVTAIAGGIGAGTTLVGLLWSTCLGAYGDSKRVCESHATSVTLAGVVVMAVSAAIGVPMIVIGQHNYKEWQRMHGGSSNYDYSGVSSNVLAMDGTEQRAQKSSTSRQSQALPVLTVLF